MIAALLLGAVLAVSAAPTAPAETQAADEPPATNAATQAPAPPSGQTAPVAPAPGAAQAPPGPGEEPTNPDYEVGPGDLLEVTVFDNQDLSRIPTVQTNGAIAMPLLGEIQVAGLTVAEIKRKVTNLLARDYLVNPQVEVKVREYQSQFVTVVGEVRSPGRKPLKGRTRLIDLLVQEAGGFTPAASWEVSIARVDGTFEDGQKTRRFRLSGGNPTPQDQRNLETPLKNGDIITASPKYYVTVEGEVNRPGRYPIEADLTVSGAISLAGGLTRFGSSSVKVRRTDPETGKVSIIKVNLKDVRNGRKPDPELHPNDLLSVPRRLL